MVNPIVFKYEHGDKDVRLDENDFADTFLDLKMDDQCDAMTDFLNERNLWGQFGIWANKNEWVKDRIISKREGI